MVEAYAGIIKERLRDAQRRYGKIGLLIDDAREAGSRVARELYGTERLPEWWLQARSAECGAHALRAFIEVFDQPENVLGVRGLALIDRFLPVRDGSERSTAWDGPKLGMPLEDRKICEGMKSAVLDLMKLREKGEGLWFEYQLITSYPHVPLEFGSEVKDENFIPWQTRSIEVLSQFRRKLRPALLVYGPEEYAEVAEARTVHRVRLYDKDAEANWKARVWLPSIKGLAKALAEANETTPIVLFTGAGASLAQGTYGAGMPPTWWLLEEACRALVHDKRGNENPTGSLREADGAAPTREEHDCCHNRRPPRIGSPVQFSFQRVTPIDWLVDHLLRSQDNHAYDLQCRLETIFSREQNRGSRRDIRRFYEYFRSLLDRFDHGFPYHYWLLAQMPWTRIITTNFDGFHERAAFAAASELKADPEARQSRLALGNVFPDSALEIEDPKFGELARSFRLFKPYGNLISPAELALGDEKLADFKARLSLAFRGLESLRHGWLVVIGHAMKDKYIGDALEALNENGAFQSRFKLIWVDPEAYQRCAPTPRGDGTHNSTWEHWMNSKVEQHENGDFESMTNRFSGPIPTTALDFVYDLWTEYQQALQRRIGGSGI